MFDKIIRHKFGQLIRIISSNCIMNRIHKPFYIDVPSSQVMFGSLLLLRIPYSICNCLHILKIFKSIKKFSEWYEKQVFFFENGLSLESLSLLAYHIGDMILDIFQRFLPMGSEYNILRFRLVGDSCHLYLHMVQNLHLCLFMFKSCLLLGILCFHLNILAVIKMELLVFCQSLSNIC